MLFAHPADAGRDGGDGTVGGIHEEYGGEVTLATALACEIVAVSFEEVPNIAVALGTAVL